MPNWDRYTIVGTSAEIFKDYLRLTSVSRVIRVRRGLGCRLTFFYLPRDTSTLYLASKGTQTGTNSSLPRSPRDTEPAQEEVAREGHVQLDMFAVQEFTAGPYRAPLSILAVDVLTARRSHSIVFAQVQRIKNEFTVTVYEIHARMALEVVCVLPTAPPPAVHVGFCGSKLTLTGMPWTCCVR